MQGFRLNGSLSEYQNKEYMLEQLNILQKELQSVCYHAEFICKQIPSENIHTILVLWQDKLEEVQIKFQCLLEEKKQFIQINGFGRYRKPENMIEYCVYTQKIHITHYVNLEEPQVIFGDKSFEIRFPRNDLNKQ